MISEKLIYNVFLKTSRSKSGLPYRLRKQWHGFEDSPQYAQVLKLRNFFERNRSVDVAEFFEAPYTIYPGESGFDLDFFSSQKAIKVYTLSLKKKMLLDADDSYHLQCIVRGLKFIQAYCHKKALSLDQYLKQREAVQSEFIVHLKERRISIYNLFAFVEFDKHLRQHDPDLLRFTLGDLYDGIPILRTKYLNSKIAKKVAETGLKKIEQNLKESS
jgi:hypothetical protein